MNILIVFILFSINAFCSNPKTYLETINEIGHNEMSAMFVHKDLKKNIEEQKGNLDILNKIRQAQIKIEEMRRRENIVSALKAAELGLTAAGVVTGGLSLATQKASKEAINWYFIKKTAAEVAKEAAGVPGYSDSAKIGVFIFNKADEKEIKSSLSKESSDILMKASEIVSNPNSDLGKKYLEIEKIIMQMENAIEYKELYIKSAVKRLEEIKKQNEELEKIAKKLKDEERKKEDELYKKVKLVEYKPNIEIQNTSVDIPVDINHKDSEDEKKAKTQSAIDKYINNLLKKITNSELKICSILRELPSPKGLRYDPLDSVNSYFNDIEYLKATLNSAQTYASAQSIEESAKNILKELQETRSILRLRDAEFKNRIEPLIKDISSNISLWKGVYSKYKPLGYRVAEPIKIDELKDHKICYITPLTYSSTFLNGTEGLEPSFSSIESAARSRKNTIYTNISQYAFLYQKNIEEFKSKATDYEKKIPLAINEAGKENEKINNLPHYFQVEFSRTGTNDIKNLKEKVNMAFAAYPTVIDKYKKAAVMYDEINSLASEINSMNSDPLYSEMSYVAYQSNDTSHKQNIQQIIKKLDGFSPNLNLGYVDFTSIFGNISNLIYSAEQGIKYLETQKSKLIAAYSKAISEFRSDSQKDFSPYYNDYDKLRTEISKLNDTINKSKIVQEEIMKEVTENSFFGEETPILKNTGFWDTEIRKKYEEMEKAVNDFWASQKGQEISRYLNIAELRKTEDFKNPDFPVIRKLYDDLKYAYESRNASKVISLIDPGWVSPDGDDISDLQDHLNKIFKMFNEINFNIAAFNVLNESGDTYKVFYNLEMISKIHSKNIKRIENSSVTEKVKVDKGKAKIIRTENGNYWVIK